MTLGQTIQRLRREKGLLQDELAEILGVSRQSVSKWETDTAVPELDRLLQLSELFGVTLDELVRGEAPPPEPEPTPVVEPQPAPVQPVGWPPRKIAGTILLCFGGLVWLLLTVVSGNLLGALVLASPFLVCGVICFIYRRCIGLWCAWTVYLSLDAYLRFAVGGLSRTAIFNAYLYTNGAVAQLVTAWAITLVLIGLIAVTLYSYRSQTAALDRYTVLWFSLCLLPFLIRAGYIAIFPHYMYPLDFPGFILYVAGFLLEWLTIAAFTALLVRLAAVLRGRRAK